MAVVIEENVNADIANVDAYRADVIRVTTRVWAGHADVGRGLVWLRFNPPIGLRPEELRRSLMPK